MSDWNQPVCEGCWIRKHTKVVAGQRDLTRVPVRVSDAPVERCCYCGGMTFVGIYVRIDPETVPFPRS